MNVDPSAPRLPAYVKGEIRNYSVAEGSELVVAIAINGVIASTTTTTSVPLSALVRDPAKAPDGDGVRYFLGRVPPTALAAGDNEVTLHGIANSQAGRGTSLIHFSPN